MKQQDELIKLLFDKDLDVKVVLENNQAISYYKKVTDIIERTHIALGRKHTYRESIQSTVDSKLNLNGIGSTTKI
jgi:hypothetical protein